MTMKARYIGLTVVFVPLLCITMVAQKVNVDFDKAATFTNFKTYTWKQGTPAKSPLMDQRILDAIDKQMTLKGLTKVAAESSPDLVLIYHAAVEYETQINTIDMGGWYGWYGPYYGGGGGTSTTTIDKIPVGTLRLDMGDVKQKKLIWQGRANSDLSDKPEKVEKTINKMSEKMFKEFPPKIKKK
jgi:hypothetical protein